MALERTTQQEQFVIVRDLLRSYNTQANIDSTGKYWNILANTIAGLGKEVSDYIHDYFMASDPENANSEMLDNWTSSLGLRPRKSGEIATGSVNVSSDAYPAQVNRGSTFTISGMQYQFSESVEISGPTDVSVSASNPGAEYNITRSVLADNDLGLEIRVNFITGGSGQETNFELLDRILVNLSSRKTTGQISDYAQTALEYAPAANASTIFFDGGRSVIPVGVRVNAWNTPGDLDVAAEKPDLVDISLSASETEDLQRVLEIQADATDRVEAGTYETQAVDNIVVSVLASRSLTSSDKQEIRKEVRKSLLQFRGDVLSPTSLNPNMPSYVQDFRFSTFVPIEKTSPVMDSVNIGVIELNRSSQGV